MSLIRTARPGTAGATVRREHERSLAFLGDACAQFEALLLARAGGRLSSLTASASQSSAVQPTPEQRKACSERVAQLGENDVHVQGQLVQRWLAQFRTDLTPAVLEHLMAIATRFKDAAEAAGGDDAATAAAAAVNRNRRPSSVPPQPSSTAASERAMEPKAALTFVLQAVHAVLQNTAAVQRDTTSLALVPVDVLRFLFDVCGPPHAASVRETAAKCLGLLSRAPSQLRAVVGLLGGRLAQLRRDLDQRQFVSYERLVPSLGFGWADAEAAAATLQHVKDQAAAMPRIERRVLRVEVCHVRVPRRAPAHGSRAHHPPAVPSCARRPWTSSSAAS